MNNTINNEQKNIKDRLITYFKGVKSEWGKITWPQKPQIVAETFIVTVVVTFFTLLVFLIDIGFKELFKFLKLI